MIYADFNGSAPLLPEIREYLAARLMDGPYANPNAIHSQGKKMLMGMEKCRRICAKVLGTKGNKIFFNSGASEGITHIFYSVLSQAPKDKNVIITSGIEHSAVVQACKHYAANGFEVVTISTLENGMVDIEDFKAKMNEYGARAALVCVMAANNETGVIQPWKEIATICNENGVPYFSDTTQYIGKTDFNFDESGMDYAVMSGHKVGALIGSGLILVKDPTNLRPLIFGGGQESGMRGGTQNYLGVETMAIALESFAKNKEKLEEVKKLREQFEANIKKDFPEAIIIGETAPRLAASTLISYPGVHGQAVQIELESNNIFVTTSSACSDNQPETSKVLKAMGIGDDTGRGVVRISLCMDPDPEKYAKIESALKAAYNKLRKIKNY